MRFVGRGCLAIAVMLLLAGCGSGRPEPRQPSPYQVRFSPNGEPMTGGPRGYPPCEQAMGRWFAAADRNHDGRVDLAEFLADADRQFTVMDLDGNGDITAAELEDYRRPFATPPAQKKPIAEDGDTSAPRVRYLAPIPGDMTDPVMAADTELRFRVSRAAFLSAAGRKYRQLGDGKGDPLDAGVVARLCAPPIEP